MQQKDMMRINMLGQEAEKLEQQIQAIEQQANELNLIRQSIEELKTKKEKDILTNLGKGIFIQTEVKSSDLLINIGSEILVKKTPEQAVEIITNQLRQLSEGKISLTERVAELQENMQQLFLELQKKENSNSSKHSCDNEDCECEEECDDCECEHEHKH